MPVWLFRICRWLPLILSILLPALSWARVGGGQHYRSGHDSAPRSAPSGGHSGGPSGGGGDVGGLIFYLLALTFEHPGLMCPLLIVGGIVVSMFLRNRDRPGSTQKAFEQREADLRTQVSPRDVEGWVNTLKLKDPPFELTPFLDRARHLFLTMQQAWRKRDLSPVRPSMSDATFQRLKVQLKLTQDQGIRDELADVQVLDAKLIGLDQSDWFDTVHLRIKAQMRDVDVPAGASDAEALKAVRAASLESFTEVWSFVRKPGVKTRIGEDLYQG